MSLPPPFLNPFFPPYSKQKKNSIAWQKFACSIWQVIEQDPYIIGNN